MCEVIVNRKTQIGKRTHLVNEESLVLNCNRDGELVLKNEKGRDEPDVLRGRGFELFNFYD